MLPIPLVIFQMDQFPQLVFCTAMQIAGLVQYWGQHGALPPKKEQPLCSVLWILSLRGASMWFLLALLSGEGEEGKGGSQYVLVSVK